MTDEDEWGTAPPGSAAGYDKLIEEYEALRKNRWLAFTDDELRVIEHGLPYGALMGEVAVEFDRRRKESDPEAPA